MNAKKSADYRNLIEIVKNKYRKNPIYAKSLTLGWCDLRQGEDLCQEINLWTYWQVFAVGYNNQGTTEIEYDISRETIFLHKENAELYLFMCNKFNNIDVMYDVNNMPELMSKCDIGITSRGRTGYELAILGIPSISMAQNKREEKHGFVCNENGFSYIGLNPNDEVIKGTLDMYLKMSQAGRKHYQDMLLMHDLRNGRKRVMNLIKGL